MITCSVPVLAVSIQWLNVSSGSVVVEMLGVQELVLNITSTNNTNYTCKVNEGIFMESEEITIQVGGLRTLIFDYINIFYRWQSSSCIC